MPINAQGLSISVFVLRNAKIQNYFIQITFLHHFLYLHKLLNQWDEEMLIQIQNEPEKLQLVCVRSTKKLNVFINYPNLNTNLSIPS